MTLPRRSQVPAPKSTALVGPVNAPTAPLGTHVAQHESSAWSSPMCNYVPR